MLVIFLIPMEKSHPFFRLEAVKLNSVFNGFSKRFYL